jgi:hypothetical protein
MMPVGSQTFGMEKKQVIRCFQVMDFQMNVTRDKHLQSFGESKSRKAD